MTTHGLADDRRGRILEVARRHLVRFGYKRTVIDDIVAEVGCAKGSFYLEFPSKEALLFAVIEEERADLKRRFEAATAGARTPAAWVRAMLRFVFDTMEEQPLMARLIVEDPEFKVVRRYARQDALQAEADAALEHTRGILREGIASGEFRPDLDLEVTPFVLGALKFLHFHAALVTDGRLDRRRFYDGIVDLAMAGIAARPGAAPASEGEPRPPPAAAEPGPRPASGQARARRRS